MPSRPNSLPLLLRALAAAAGLGLAARLAAQTAITAITTTWSDTTNSSQTLVGQSTTIDNSTLAVNTLTDASGNTYTVSGVATIGTMRFQASPGSTSANTDPADISAWYMGNAASSTSAAPTALLGAYDSGSPGSLLLGNNILRGSDNLFNNINSTSGGQNNADPVERMDLVYSTTGLVSDNTLSIGVFDRGSGDTFKIALITGVDTNGNPTSYGGNLVTVSTSDFGVNLLTTSNANSTVLDGSGNLPTEYLLRYDSITSLAAGNVTFDTKNQTQNIAGVVLHMSDFGIASGTRVYGYSLMAGDVTDGGNINNLVNYNNTTYFPTNTNDNSSNGDNGGLDPVAINGVIFTEHPLPEPSTYGLVLCGLALAAVAYRRLRPAAA